MNFPGIVWISLWTMELGLQFLIFCGLISSFFPIPLGNFLNGILPFFYDMVRPEREMLLYALFIGGTVSIQISLLWLYSKKVISEHILGQIRQRVILGGICLALQLTGIVHIFLYHDPRWARALLYLGMVLFILVQFVNRNSIRQNALD